MNVNDGADGTGLATAVRPANFDCGLDKQTPYPL